MRNGMQEEESNKRKRIRKRDAMRVEDGNQQNGPRASCEGQERKKRKKKKGPSPLLQRWLYRHSRAKRHMTLSSTYTTPYSIVL